MLSEQRASNGDIPSKPGKKGWDMGKAVFSFLPLF